MPIDAISNNISTVAPYKNASGKATNSGKGDAGSTDKDAQEVRQLANLDREVRAHEAAHVAAGGQYVRGGATFQYQKGPDGKMYAVGGEVSIDTSPVKGDPQATISKMEAVKSAAMAPADPSGQDRAVAAAASAAEAAARKEATQAKTGDAEKGNESAVIGLTNNKKAEKPSAYNGKGEAISTSSDAQRSLLNLVT